MKYRPTATDDTGDVDKVKQARFAVMLHGYDLIIPHSSGGECVGGLWTWRYVSAENAAAAVIAAIDMVKADPSFLDHVRHIREFPPSFEASEVVELQRDDLRHGDGTGLVFYIDPDEQREQ